MFLLWHSLIVDCALYFSVVTFEMVPLLHTLCATITIMLVYLVTSTCVSTVMESCCTLNLSTQCVKMCINEIVASSVQGQTVGSAPALNMVKGIIFIAYVTRFIYSMLTFAWTLRFVSFLLRECHAFLLTRVYRVGIDYRKIPSNNFGDNVNGKVATISRLVLGDLSNEKKASNSFEPRKRCSDSSQSNRVRPPKRGRKMSPASDSHKCGSCTIWLQTGSISELEKFHKMNPPKHSNECATEFSSYVSMGGKFQINLRPENCLCSACYRDCLRGTGEPRWYKLSRRLIAKHCLMCCYGSCDCKTVSVDEWAGPDWWGKENFSMLLEKMGMVSISPMEIISVRSITW